MRLTLSVSALALICLAHSTGAAIINVDTSQAPDLAIFGGQVKDILTQYYDRAAELLRSPNFTPQSTINITFDASYDGVAYASNGRIVGSVRYYRDHQNDYGSMVHEMAHIIQAYPNGCPGWLVEGIADWVRYFNYEPNRKPNKPSPGQNYTNGYGVSAYFLQYIIDVSNFSPHMVYWANKDCRERQYNDDLWPRLTGKTLNQHWNEMMNANKGPLTITVDTSQAPDLASFGSKVKSALTEWYPKISNELLPSPNFDAPKNIRIYFDPNYKGVAYTSGSTIVASVDYYRSHLDDVGSMIHEMTHVIQSYKGENCPGWLTEGIADWVRYYNYEPSRKPSKPTTSQSYRQGYGTAAYFLEYINSVTNYRPNMVYWANKDCREGKYADTLYPRLTGKTLEEQWATMMKP